MKLVVYPAAEVRACIAAELVDDADATPDIGSVHLRPRQRAAARRIAEIIARRGGAMLADPVGTGKTFTALAVAARYENVLITAPAALRGMWQVALERAGARAELTSHEALSRGLGVSSVPDLVVVDEAHRFRNADTARYAALADIARRAHVLLVTATPLQNRRDDLVAQIALFAGRAAWSMTDEELASHIVRAPAGASDGLPEVSGPHRITMATIDDCLDEILALPPPVPPRGESIAPSLLVYSLVHQWSSSRAALVAALRRRQMRGAALMAALDSGRHPSRAELSAWTDLGDAMQLAFPELVATAAPPAPDHAPEVHDLAALAVAVDRHNAGVAALLRRCRSLPDPDAERADLLRQLMVKHPGERIIAFCQYAETVNVLYSRLRAVPRVAALTAAGGRVAGGRISRDAMLRQFAPPRGGEARIRDIERIDLLLTTDLLSEGLDLQQASIVVHLDLPWNPARLEQRVGRARRFGAPHDVVTVYTLAPPAPADRLLNIEQRLRDKLRVARRTVGVSGHILPAIGAPAQDTPAVAEHRGAAYDRLRAWITHAPRDDPPMIDRSDRSIVAAVRSPTAGFLALLDDDSGSRLIADVGCGMHSLDDSPATINVAIELAEGPEAELDAKRADAACTAIDRWRLARRGESVVDLGRAAAARPRRATLLRVSQALARAPRHRRAELSALAAAARLVATAPLAEGAERVLDVLARSPLPDEAWLRSIAAFGEMNARPAPAGPPGDHAWRIVALIVFQRDERAS